MKSGSQRRKSHFCSVCQRVVKMDMLRKGPDDEVTWLKCPDCEGYVPFLSSSAKEMMGLEEDFLGTVIPDDVPQYDMSQNYDIGQVFYHPVWDDYGLVLRKGKKSKKGRAIMVSFVKGGLKKIVEDFQQPNL
jgi:hypothetical protein